MRTIVLSLLIAIVAFTSYAADKNLHERFEDYDQIKVYLDDVTDRSGNPAVSTAKFRDIFNDVLKKRINVYFIPVTSEKEADVVVNVVIDEYAFERVAMPLFFSWKLLLIDATSPKSYAKLTVNYRIQDPKNGRTLLEYNRFTVGVRRPIKQMKGDSAFIYAAAMSTNRFLYRAFYKQKPSLSPFRR
ncbi:MAG: hypothetical protein JW994_05135 [Candidatus Omnitrophica bacterium]|nr:hypothetical protein [Candidatus Omnitrophota bacterium]